MHTYTTCHLKYDMRLMCFCGESFCSDYTELQRLRDMNTTHVGTVTDYKNLKIGWIRPLIQTRRCFHLVYQLLWSADRGHSTLRSIYASFRRLFSTGKYGEQWKKCRQKRHKCNIRNRTCYLGRTWNQRSTCFLPVTSPGDSHRPSRLYCPGNQSKSYW